MKNFLANLAVVVALLGAMEVGANIYLRAKAQPSPIHDRRAVVPQEMADRVLGNARLYEMPKPRQGDDYNIDDNGFRSSAGTRDVFASFNAEANNVFAFGGSMTFGHGVKDAETWPAQLQKLLPAAKIYNVGQGGASSHEELFLLVQLLSEGKVPKVALFVDGGNEQCPEPADRSKTLRRLTERPPPMLALDWLLAKSSAVELLGRSRAKSEPTDTAVSLQDCAAKYARRALLAQNLLGSYGAIGIFAFQPSGSTIPNYATFKFWSYGNPSSGSVAQLNGLYDAYIGAARASGVKNVVDLRHILDAQALAGAELFVDHQHPSAAGHNLIAKEIRSLLERAL